MSKPSLVLVHGAWHSPKHFGPIVERLEGEYGYKCIAVSLPSTQTPDEAAATLADDSKAVRDAVTAELDAGNHVVVVAHSYGGTPTNNALRGLDAQSRRTSGAETCVQGIAFLNGIPLPAGTAFIDALGGKPHAMHDLRGDFAWVGPPGPEHYFYNEMAEEDQKHWSALLRQQSWLAILDKTEYAAYNDFPCWYLSCQKDQALEPRAQEELVAGAKAGGASIELVKLEGADHTPFIGKHMQATIDFIQGVDAFHFVSAKMTYCRNNHNLTSASFSTRFALFYAQPSAYPNTRRILYRKSQYNPNTCSEAPKFNHTMFSILKDDGYGKNRREGSTSLAAILGVFVPTFIIALINVVAFLLVRNYFRKVYAPRTFLGTIPEKDRTPSSTAHGKSWFHDFRNLTDRFVLQHNSLDAYLYLRFLKFVIYVCLAGALLTWPILFPINATGGGNASQLDRISFSNIAKNDHLWGHTAVAWVFFLGIFAVIAVERLQLIGLRQAYYLSDTYASRLSARTVLFLNVPAEAARPESLKKHFGHQAEHSWPVKDLGDLEDLVEKRNGAAYSLEAAELDYITKYTKLRSKGRPATNGADGAAAEEALSPLAKAARPTSRRPILIGTQVDRIDEARKDVADTVERLEAHRSAPGRNIPAESAVFVAFASQEAAHRAFQQIRFHPHLPLEDRFLSVQPKEVLWKNIQMPIAVRASKASLALAFVIAFTIFFSIPVGLIGTLSNVKELSDRVKWLGWLQDLPDWILGLLVGFVPPFLTSWFVSYVPKLFRHIAKLSGEPTIPQAELKTQAWYMVFQVFQVFLVTTFSSGAAAVATKIAKDPKSAPDLLAESLPKASNFYLTYFILQGTTSAASNLLDYSETLEYLFYEYFWDRTPRDKFQTYAQMRGTPWAAWYPKFTNFLIIAVAYSCIQPLTLGFAAVGLYFYYLSYRYSLLYVRQTKTDTKGEAYKRALQQMPTGLYLAELALIGLFGARKAAAQSTLMIVLLVLTAVGNVLLDRMLRPLELYLGVDKWSEPEQERLLAEEDGADTTDDADLHASAHGRRLGLKKLPKPMPRWLSDFFDSIISASREKASSWLRQDAGWSDDSVQFSEDDIKKAYIAPAFTSKTPKLWIPRDNYGISKQEIEANEREGMASTDEAAEIDEDGRLHWNHNFEEVPIFSKAKAV
ncbi:hypothetical protein AC579_4908 [Pseudocercospora musae]|uniref:AB hydrolase-1 domain-containing protein n=1 Tax=Pseudocercospora musae TaxID=113226 RepID=A0A139IE85_9PEZI|nr:hypothetical protein AC579_4908 [Pseudocercospora musae]